jgi:predicted acylesterase/phospholipase RssA
VLVIEGGGSRAAYSTGMIGAIHELGLTGCFDAVYGSSAGALNGAWLLCGRAPQAMAGWTAPGVMRRVMSTRRTLLLNVPAGDDDRGGERQRGC